jgi:malonyl-CoA/methylmalonyl-CoA synthetase
VTEPSPLLAGWQRQAATARTAVIDAAGAHSFADIDRRARSLATLLLARGERGERGDAAPASCLFGERVGLLVSPDASFVEAFFGVLLAGGTVVVLSPLHPAPETTYFCDDARVRTILASPDLAPRLADLAGPARDVIVLDASVARLPEPRHDLPSATASDDALQLYTSGTTGKPKGAVITHGNLGTQQALLGDAWGFCADDVLLHTLPLHHMHGLAIALLSAIGAGATTRMLASFDATLVWEAMSEATAFMAVPTIYARLLAAHDAADAATRARWMHNARSLRLATSGSAALPVTLAERWRAIARALPVERFGMTEIGVGMTNPLHGERKPGFVGRPLPTVETRITDDSGAPAAEGELWIRGPSVFRGYWQNEDATRAAFQPDPGGGAPWFRTGDTVATDADGYFKILGRTSIDILKSGGYKLSALEIEEVLRAHPAILDVAVIGVPDEAWGDRVVACVIARPGHEASCTSESVRAFARERVAPYKVPKEVVVLRELPRNAIGKVTKAVLVQRMDRIRTRAEPKKT